MLGLHGRMSSSRMLIHKLTVTYIPEPCSLIGTGNHVEAVTALLSAASLPRAARNLQIVFSCTQPLLSHPGRVNIRVMLCALQFSLLHPSCQGMLHARGRDSPWPDRTGAWQGLDTTALLSAVCSIQTTSSQD